MLKRLVAPLGWLLAATAFVACQADPLQAPATVDNGQGDTRSNVPDTASCHSPSNTSAVLVDASHDGGAWWFPQVAPFDPEVLHQGKALADYLRARGFVVEELGRGSAISADQLLAYPVVVRAGNFGAYRALEVTGYRQFVSCRRTLLLLGEFLRPGETDAVADALDIPFTGWVNGTVTEFAPHEITAGVTALQYIAGATLPAKSSTDLKILGRLGSGEPVMGLLERGQSKIWFIGDTNGIELVPQPLVDNLIAWGFPVP